MQSALYPTGCTVIIPCRRCSPYLPECLDSLLAQDFQDWTCLIADDASDDTTEEVVAPYVDDPRITFRSLDKRGWLLGNTLDALRLTAPGPADVVAILDGDDTLLPGALSRIMKEHAKGFDVVWTDMEIEGVEGSTGAPLIEGIPVREQLWCLSQLRTFKGYLLEGLDQTSLHDPTGSPCRAAGDLALYFPLIERAGIYKTSFVPEQLYHYRVHDCCNFKVMRSEQLNNNTHFRAMPAHGLQTTHFDFSVKIENPQKLELRRLGRDLRKEYPAPYTVCAEHRVPKNEYDSWRAYHGLWIEKGVYLKGIYE